MLAPHQVAVARSPLDRFASALVLLLALLACHGEAAPGDSRPSFLLFVIDTLRADAVSAFGEVEGTTPYLDRLAERGLLYRRAWSAASWTIPSHASIFTGQEPHRHGIGIGGRVTDPGTLATLAERLSTAGYETAGFSENPLVGRAFGLSRGFETYASRPVGSTVGGSAFDADQEALRWLEQVPPGRPFLLFVNVMDPHEPYRLRAGNVYLPAGIDAAAARASQERFPRGICGDLPPPRHLAILRGLYLDGVRAADDKLRAVHEGARRAAGEAGLVAVITSDHGEHFGERRLLDHQFSVHEALLHVPLVVHGLDVPAASLDTPVSLIDVAPSLLRWSGAEPGLPGRPLPTASGASSEARTLRAVYSEWRGVRPRDWPDPIPPLWSPGMLRGGAPRASCGPDDRVFGEMVAALRFPFKLIWFERYPSELYDLSWDPGEHSDLAALDRARTTQLEAEIQGVSDALAAARAEGGVSLEPKALEALRALGYVE